MLCFLTPHRCQVTPELLISLTKTGIIYACFCHTYRYNWFYFYPSLLAGKYLSLVSFLFSTSHLLPKGRKGIWKKLGLIPGLLVLQAVALTARARLLKRRPSWWKATNVLLFCFPAFLFWFIFFIPDFFVPKLFLARKRKERAFGLFSCKREREKEREGEVR